MAPKNREFNPNTIELLPSKNVANLEKIVCNVLESVLLRLLVCKDEKSGKTPEDCPYPEHKNCEADKLVCNNSEAKLAQIYIRHDKVNAQSRSCVIVFVEAQYLSKTEELLERLQNSISWLDIENERPYFYIFHYGPPACQLTANNSCKRINAKMKELFTGYSQDEDICIAVSVQRGSKSLIVNHRTKFSLIAS
jgi:hypothetical protein